MALHPHIPAALAPSGATPAPAPAPIEPPPGGWYDTDETPRRESDESYFGVQSLFERSHL